MRKCVVECSMVSKFRRLMRERRTSVLEGSKVEEDIASTRANEVPA
jgi:hypothetical protein